MSDLNNVQGTEVKVIVENGGVAPKSKLQRVSIKLIRPNPENDRFMPGNKVAGMEMPDTLNLGIMKMVILGETVTKRAGQMPEPLHIEAFYNVDADGKRKLSHYIAHRGNRRCLAGLELYNDPNTPQNVIQELETVEAYVYENLSQAYRDSLIHDKMSQGLRRSELLALAWRHQDNGLTFSEIAIKMAPLLANYTAQGQQKWAQISQKTDVAARKKEILTWLKGTLDMKILAAGNLGDRVRRAYMVTELRNDALIPVDGQQPEFSIRQNRMNELKQLKADEKDVWTTENGSPLFNAKIDQYHAEDYPILDQDGNAIKPVTEDLTKRSVKDISEFQTARAKSASVKAALEYAKGGAPANFADLDARAFLNEKVVNALVGYADWLPLDLKCLAQRIKDGLSPAEIVGWIETFVPADKIRPI